MGPPGEKNGFSPEFATALGEKNGFSPEFATALGEKNGFSPEFAAAPGEKNGFSSEFAAAPGAKNGFLRSLVPVVQRGWHPGQFGGRHLYGGCRMNRRILQTKETEEAH